MKIIEKNGNFIICPTGHIDSASAPDFLKELMETVKGHEEQKIEIDMSGVEYVSSAGLRAFLKLGNEGYKFFLTGLIPAVYEVFEITGFTELFEVKKAMRTVPVDGCEVIGRGFYGTIYRLDEDTIVKVYESPDSIPMIESEQKKAKQAFLKGIPTAISYDVVKVGNSYGSVFELLKARTLNDIIIEEPERADEVITKYVDFVKLVHGTAMEPGSLPNADQLFKGYLERIKKYLTDEQYDTLKTYLDQFPEDDHVVHGDFHMKNIMMVDGEPMLIDMDTLSIGHPIFDLAGIYVTYKAFIEDEPGRNSVFLGIDDKMCGRIWSGIRDIYFKDVSENEKEHICDRIKLAAAIRFLYIIENTDIKNEELGPVRIRHVQEHIRELIDRIDGLYFEV